MSTHYEILDIKSDATKSEIKAAYQKATLKLRADKNTQTEEQFKLVDNAYKVLIDDDSRKQYDASLLHNAKPQLALVLSEDHPSSGNNMSMVVRKTLNFSEAVKLAKMPVPELIKMAQQDIAVAESICESPELIKYLDYNFLEISYTHEELACTILRDKKYWPKSGFLDQLLFELAERYWKVCEIILGTPFHFDRLCLTTIVNLKIQHKDKFELRCTERTRELITIHDYLESMVTREILNDAESQTIVAYLNKIIKYRDYIGDVSSRCESIAKIVIVDDKLRAALEKNHRSVIACIAVDHESTMCLLLKIPSYDIFRGFVHMMGQKYWSACNIILQIPRYLDKLEPAMLCDFYKVHGDKFIACCDEATKEKIAVYRYFERILRGQPAVLIDRAELEKNLLRIKDDREQLEFTGRKLRLAAEIICDTEKLVKPFLSQSVYSLISVIIDYEDLLNRILTTPKYWPKDGFWSEDLKKAAAKYESVCRTILLNSSLCKELDGESLYKLTMKYGAGIAALINANPDLSNSLRAYLLLKNCKLNTNQSLSKETAAVSQNDADALYNMGCLYLDQKTRPGKDNARYYFHLAALLGHLRSMEKLEQLIESNDKAYITKIIFIYADHINQLYDLTRAHTWLTKLVNEYPEEKPAETEKEDVDVEAESGVNEEDTPENESGDDEEDAPENESVDDEDDASENESVDTNEEEVEAEIEAVDDEDEDANNVVEIIREEKVWRILFKFPGTLVALAKNNIDNCKYILTTPDLARMLSGELLYECILLHGDDIARHVLDNVVLEPKMTEFLEEKVRAQTTTVQPVIYDQAEIFTLIGEHTKSAQSLHVARYYFYKGAVRANAKAMAQIATFAETQSDHLNSGESADSMEYIALLLDILFIYVDPENSLSNIDLARNILKVLKSKDCKIGFIVDHFVKYINELWVSMNSDESLHIPNEVAMINVLAEYYNRVEIYVGIADVMQDSAYFLEKAIAYYLKAIRLREDHTILDKLIFITKPYDIANQWLIFLFFADQKSFFHNRNALAARIPTLRQSSYFEAATYIVNYLGSYSKITPNDEWRAVEYLKVNIPAILSVFNQEGQLNYCIGLAYENIQQWDIARYCYYTSAILKYPKSLSSLIRLSGANRPVDRFRLAMFLLDPQSDFPDRATTAERLLGFLQIHDAVLFAYVMEEYIELNKTMSQTDVKKIDIINSLFQIEFSNLPKEFIYLLGERTNTADCNSPNQAVAYLCYMYAAQLSHPEAASKCSHIETNCKNPAVSLILAHLFSLPTSFLRNKSLHTQWLIKATELGSIEAGFQLMVHNNPKEKLASLGKNFKVSNLFHTPVINSLIAIANSGITNKNYLHFRINCYLYLICHALLSPGDVALMEYVAACDKYYDIWLSKSSYEQEPFIIQTDQGFAIFSLKCCVSLIRLINELSASFSAIRLNLYHELLRVLTIDDFVKSFSELNLIYAEFARYYQNIGKHIEYTTAIERCITKFELHKKDLEERIAEYEKVEDNDSAQFYQRRIPELNALISKIRSIRLNYFYDDCAGNTCLPDKIDIRVALQQIIDPYLNATSNLTKHKDWTTKKVNEKLSRLHSVFGGIVETNSVKFIKNTIMPLLDNAFGWCASEVIIDTNENEMEMREMSVGNSSP